MTIEIKKSTVIIVGVCLVALAAVGIIVKKSKGSKGGFPGKGGPGGFGGGQNSVVSVKTYLAKNEVLHDYVKTNGEIKCESAVDVYPDMGGKIAKVFVSLGSSVKKGDVLAEVDPSEPGAYYVHSNVYAPISGTITSTPLEVGAKVNSQTRVTTIGDVSNLQISSKVAERYVSFLKPGLKADIVLEAYPDDSFRATVVRVSPVVDAASRTKEVILQFDKTDEKINAGMFAKVTLWTADYEGFIAVPANSIIEKNLKKYVYVLKEDGETVTQREVSTGKSVDSKIQLVSGVSVGDSIVVEGMTVCSEGAKVRDITNGFVPSESKESGEGNLPAENSEKPVEKKDA